jgi:AraC family transcriptional activator of pobA
VIPVAESRRLMVRFGELVEQHFRDNLSIAEYARALHVSESRLRTACIESTGQPPIQLIHARIVLEAKRQLHYTNNPVN